MGFRKAVATALAICATVAMAGSANAFMMSLGGPVGPMGPGGAAADAGADALYATDHFGREIKIAEVDVPGPDGVMLRDLGIPSVDGDGNVWFSAAVMDGRQLRWRIFHANPDAPLSDPVAFALPSSPDTAEVPVMRVDPRPVRADDGSLIFSTEMVGGGDAVFRVSSGKLIPIVRTGARLADGRTVRKIVFGTVQPAGNGQIALSAYLAPQGQAVLLVSEDGQIKVIAAEGVATADGAHYRAGFSPPAATDTDHGAVVAFTAHTDRGAGVFLYGRGTTHRIFSTGEGCRRGTVSYVSTERPGLSSNGMVAVLANCAGTPTIYLLDDGKVRAVARANQQAEYPGEFSELGGPQLSRSGTVVFGAVGSDEIDRLFALSRTGRTRRIAPRELERFDRPVLDAASEISHTVSPATLSINSGGTAAYLGGR